MTQRRKLPFDLRHQVLHETGYSCGNPSCRRTLTLDVHHIAHIGEGGKDEPANLLALCGHCHDMHHQGHIPTKSVRSWKMLAVALSEGIGRNSMDVLLALHAVGSLMISGEGVLQVASAVAAKLVEVSPNSRLGGGWASAQSLPAYELALSDRGRVVVQAWIDGDQDAVAKAGLA